MKIFKKPSEMSVPGSIVLAGLLISVSIFFTVYFFFGGANNRTKLFLTTPVRPSIPTNYNPQIVNTQAANPQVQQPQKQATNTSPVLPSAKK